MKNIGNTSDFIEMVNYLNIHACPMDWAERLGFFTKILKPLYENDRSRAWYQAITWMILGYVEILMHIMWANVKETKFKPKKAGFLINQKQSVETPSQDTEFLGFNWTQ